MVSFSAPLVLLLLPLPALVARWLPPRRATQAALILPDALEQRARRASQAQPARTGSRGWLVWLLWASLIVALAGPRQLLPVPALKMTGRDLAIALDLSGSMVREDFSLNGEQVSRLDAVKAVGAEFARGRGGDRLALILFGSDAYYAAPFTFDTEAIARRIEEATIGISGRATNISDALGLALKRLRDSEAKSRVVILLSDGANNAGTTDPLAVAQLAARSNVRIHTIAMGPKDLASAPDERGVVDARTLDAIAQLSGGQSYRVRTTDDLRRVSHQIDALEAIDRDGLAADIYRPLWPWVAALAGAIALILHLRPDDELA